MFRKKLDVCLIIYMLVRTNVRLMIVKYVSNTGKKEKRGNAIPVRSREGP
jgi:hypothetical protein